MAVLYYLRKQNKEDNKLINIKTIMKKLILLTATVLSCLPFFAHAQESEAIADSSVIFKLKERDGHYSLNVDINGTLTKVTICTSQPALYVDEKFYEKNKGSWKLRLMPSHSKVISQYGSYDIKYSGLVLMHIGNAIYNGPIYVVKKFNKISMPIQYLRLGNNKTSIVKLDLPNKQMSLLTRSMLAKDTMECNSFPLKKSEKGLFPVIRTRLTLRANYSTIHLDGDFIVSIGNAGLVSLLIYNNDVARMIEDNKIKLKSVQSGKIVPKWFVADECAIAGYGYGKNNIDVTPMYQNNVETGLIGLKFFVTPVIFDFSKKKVYIKQKGK